MTKAGAVYSALIGAFVAVPKRLQITTDQGFARYLRALAFPITSFVSVREDLSSIRKRLLVRTE